MALRIIIGILSAFAVYLVGAFIAVDFDFSKWHVVGRAFVGIFMPLVFIAAATYPIMED